MYSEKLATNLKIWLYHNKAKLFCDYEAIKIKIIICVVIDNFAKLFQIL